jgi:hypothetical protein
VRPVYVKKHGICRSCYDALRRQGTVGRLATCSAPGCSGRVAARGVCDRHYRRLLRRGTTELRTVEERLKKGTSRQPDGCWLWTGLKASGGYGRIKIDGTHQQVHRVAYEMHIGPIPDGLQLDHLCRNKACVNPDHLEPVTQRENILRSDNMAARWARRTECHVCGGPFTIQANRRACLACQRRLRNAANARKRAGR